MSEQNDVDTIRGFFDQGGTLQALVNVDPSHLDNIYAYACQLFDAGEYASARNFYDLLVRLSHWQYEYWLALGLCHQRLSEHTQAVFCFGKAALLRLDAPNPPYLAGLSYCQTGNYNKANEAFTAALKWCAAKQEHALLKTEILRQQTLFSEELAYE